MENRALAQIGEQMVAGGQELIGLGEPQLRAYHDQHLLSAAVMFFAQPRATAKPDGIVIALNLKPADDRFMYASSHCSYDRFIRRLDSPSR